MVLSFASLLNQLGNDSQIEKDILCTNADWKINWPIDMLKLVNNSL